MNPRFFLFLLSVVTYAVSCTPAVEPKAQPALATLPYSFACHVEQPSLYEIDLDVSLPNADWRAEGNESVTARVLVDGTFSSNLILPGGIARWSARTISRTVLPAGEHEITVEVDAARSRSDSKVQILAASCLPVPEDRVPLLIGRDGLRNSFSDMPIAMYTAVHHGMTEYHVIFSNEDGGTGAFPAMLLAQWGRLIDTEWIWRYPAGSTGAGEFQSAGHGTKAFSGTIRGVRPVFETSTANNNFAMWKGNLDSDLDGKLLFSLPVVPAPIEVEARLLERYPQWQQLSNLELRREHGWETPPDPVTWDLPDLRKILWVDYTGDDLPTVGIGVQTGSGNYSADRGQEDFRSSGSDFRTGIEIPEGDIPAYLRLDTNADLTGIHGSFRVFMLDKDYRPVELMTVTTAEAASK